MRTLAATAILAILVASPAFADSDKHRRHAREYSYGALVSQCNHRANGIGLRGYERRDFVAWCTDRGRAYAWREWERRDWDRIRYARFQGDWQYAALQDFLRWAESD